MAAVSGPAWCAKFPTSAMVDDLSQDFRAATKAVISDMKKGGATDLHRSYLPLDRARLSDALVLRDRLVWPEPRHGGEDGGR